MCTSYTSYHRRGQAVWRAEKKWNQKNELKNWRNHISVPSAAQTNEANPRWLENRSGKAGKKKETEEKGVFFLCPTQIEQKTGHAFITHVFLEPMDMVPPLTKTRLQTFHRICGCTYIWNKFFMTDCWMWEGILQFVKWSQLLGQAIAVAEGGGMGVSVRRKAGPRPPPP